MDKHFVLADPKNFDGDPFDVATRAVAQAAAMATLLYKAIEDAEITARNAEMERNLGANLPAGAEKWETSPQGKRYDELKRAALVFEKRIGALVLAASFNPKKPIKEE